MLSELLATRAALYAAGSMATAERDAFELVLEFHADLRAHVAELGDVTTALALSDARPAAAPPSDLKTRILSTVGAHALPAAPAALVVTDPAGRVEWINPAFSAMCGFTLKELAGHKPGQVLQGAATDAAAVRRIRTALAALRPVRETMVNYHKNGSAYRVDIEITPILDDERAPLWFVAQEHKLAEL
jgi:PAS domain S-box-containing protein